MTLIKKMLEKLDIALFYGCLTILASYIYLFIYQVEITKDIADKIMPLSLFWGGVVGIIFSIFKSKSE